MDESVRTTAPAAGPPSGLERTIRRDRLMVATSLAILIALSWTYLVRMAAAMSGAVSESDMHAAMGMPDTAAWGAAELFSLFVMWAVMMAGMMLPSAAPVILLVLLTYRRRGDRTARASTAVFIGGYLFAWTVFSAAAAALQFLLHEAALLSPAMATRSTLAAGIIFIVAGIYQWLPIKRACLTHCRSPLGFIGSHWREEIGGAFRMGAHHGLFCVGCCWALMALLFASGVMNLFWVAVIAAFVLVEKLIPQGPWLGKTAGALLVLWGGAMLIQLTVDSPL